MPLSRTKTRTTTVRLPLPLYQELKALVEKEKDASFNDFIVSAVKGYLRMYRRRQIDAAFAGMALDTSYQKEALSIAKEFEHSDWETLGLQESGLAGNPDQI